MKFLMNLILGLSLTMLLLSCIDEDLGASKGDSAGTGVLSYSLNVLDEPADGGSDCCKKTHRHGPWMILKALDLSDEQWIEIKAVMKDCRKTCFKAKKGEKPTFEEMKKNHKARMDSLITRIKPVLTEEQREKLSSIKEALESGKVPPELIDVKVGKLTKKLELTEEQQGRLKEIFTVSMQKIMEIKESAEDPKTAFASIKTVHTETCDKVEGVLTDRQLEKFEALKAERKAKWGGKGCDKKKNGSRACDRLKHGGEKKGPCKKGKI